MSQGDDVRKLLKSDRYSKAINQALRWLRIEQNQDGSYGKPEGAFVDLAGYYKSSWAFAIGRNPEAGEKLVGFLEKRLLTPEGDLLTGSDQKKSEVWAYQNLLWYYMNGWICAGAWI